MVVMDREVRDMMDMGMEDMTMVFYTQLQTFLAQFGLVLLLF